VTRGRWRLITGATVAASAAVLLYFMPLFHVVPLDVAGQRASGTAFDPAAVVDRFWTERLIPGTGGAVDAADLVAAVQQDRHNARQTYGRRMGLGGVYYYFIAGSGRVVAVDRNSVGLALRDDQGHTQVLLEAGPIFGNAVRDGTGLLDVNDFANSQDFNALSAEINRRIEQNVLPELRRLASVGAPIRFVGCAEIVDEDADLNPLRIVPFIVEAP
jgi:predicted lipoprotein